MLIKQTKFSLLFKDKINIVYKPLLFITFFKIFIIFRFA